MEDHVRPVGDRLGGRARRRKDRPRAPRSCAGKARRLTRRHDVEKRELVDRLAVERFVGDQPLGQLAADHAGRAGDEDVHAVLLQREAAVDEMRLAGDVARLVGGEEQRERRDLLRRAEPAHGLAVDEGLAHRFERLA